MLSPLDALIMQTCPCDIYHHTNHLYIVELGFMEVYFFFSYFCSVAWIAGAHLSRLTEAVQMCTPGLCFGQGRKNITIFHLKIIFFTAVKNCSILHGCVIIMIHRRAGCGCSLEFAFKETLFSTVNIYSTCIFNYAPSLHKFLQKNDTN